MTLLRRSPISCIGNADVTFNHPAEVRHYTGAPLSTVLDFHHYILIISSLYHHYIIIIFLIKPLSMLVIHCCKVLWKKLRCDWRN